MELKKITNNLITILKSEDLQNLKGTFVSSISERLWLIKGCGDFIHNLPNIIFLDKMEKFLYGTYHNIEEQTKMSSLFLGANSEYEKFVKRQILLLNEMNEDDKIIYYSNLTRSVLLELIDIPLYFKLSNILLLCTSEELDYLEKNINNQINELNIFIDSFLLSGLVKVSNYHNDKAIYKYTSLGKSLVNYGININNDNKYSHSEIVELSNLKTFETTTTISLSANEW